MDWLKTATVFEASDVKLLPKYTTDAIKSQPLTTLVIFEAVSSIEKVEGREIAMITP